MAGNTRGKLKEHFEGIHRNFDWSLHHINTALALIFVELEKIQVAQQLSSDEVTVKAIAENHPLYKGIKSLGDGIQTLDELAQKVYEKL
jgi:hypothetical protein